MVSPQDGSPFSVDGRLTLANNLPAGTYVLQLAATSDDPTNAKKYRTAVQRISFDVR
jgi:hypothetical protein